MRLKAIVLGLFSLVVSNQPSWSQAKVNSTQSAAVASTNAANNASSTSKSANIDSAAAAPNTVASVKDMGKLISNLKWQLLGVRWEVERKEEQEIDPNVLDTSLLDNPQMTPIDPSAGAAMAPRQEWLDMYNFHITNLAKMLSKQVDSLAMPSDPNSDAAFSVSEMKRIMKQVNVNVPAFVALASGNTCDGDQIAIAANNLYTDVAGIDKARKQLLKSLKK
jgi:hypothetical protein